MIWPGRFWVGGGHKIPHFGHHLLQVAHLFSDDGQFAPGRVVKPRGLEKLPGKPPDDQEGVFDFVGDVGHGIAHGRQTFGLEQSVFHGLVFGDVPHDGGKIQVALNFGHGEGDAQGKCLSVPAPGVEAALPAQDVGLPGGQIAPDIVPVDLGEGRRDNEFQVLAQGFGPGIAEHRLGAPVVADDHVLLVDGDEGVGGAHDDAGVDLLLLAQLLELAHQGFQETGGGTGDEVARLFRGEAGYPIGEELAVQDEIEGLRVQIRQAGHRQAGGRGLGPAAIEDQIHRGVTFQEKGSRTVWQENS